MVTIRLRRDYSSEWERNNPVLLLGEPGYERDTRRLKIGDGQTPWSALPYIESTIETGSPSLPDHINSPLPHPVYDEGPSLTLLYENAKV